MSKRDLFPMLSSAACIKRQFSPVLTKDDIPYDAELIFNAGVAKYQGKYVCVFRNDYGVDRDGFEAGGNFAGTSIGVAYSDNGIDGWQVSPAPLVSSDDIRKDGESRRLYDPRITVIDGRPYLCLAYDTEHGILGCIAEINDSFDKINIISRSVPDNRNMVLFSEKIGGEYIRLERPMPVYSRGRDRFDIWASASPDLRYWGNSRLVLGVEDVPYANDKIGPAAPPVKTEKGWLTTFHAVDIDDKRSKNGWEKAWKKRYSAGIMLLDLDDPTKVLGVCKTPLLTPETYFETEMGFRENVIFPGGMILEESGEVKIYYGASDTVECLASADVDELISLCLE